MTDKQQTPEGAALAEAGAELDGNAADARVLVNNIPLFLRLNSHLLVVM